MKNGRLTLNAKVTEAKVKQDYSGGKLTVGFELELPKPTAAASYEQWLKMNSWDGGPTPAERGPKTKRAEAAEEPTPAEREAALHGEFDAYLKKAIRQNRKAAAAAQTAGILLVLIGQQVTLHVEPHQREMFGYLLIAPAARTDRSDGEELEELEAGVGTIG